MAEHNLISKTALLRHLDMAMECENCPRNADKELYKCVHNPTSERCTCSDIAQICIRITEFATFADVQPVKRGRWIKDEKGTFHHCSECGSESFRDVDSWGLEYQEYCTDYCPHCGARMIKDGDTECHDTK